MKIVTRIFEDIVPTKTSIVPDLDTYTGDGNVSMDKTVKGYYIKDNQELMIESLFAEERTVRDVIKAQLLDRICNKIEMATPVLQCYNDDRNTVVVASEEVIQ